MRVHKLQILLLSFIIFSGSYAKKLNPDPTIESMIKQNKLPSALSNYASRKDLKILEKKLKHKKNLGIRIYGDSHMAADFFPRIIRMNLIPSNSIGFSYPLQPKYQQNLNLKYSYENFEILNSKNPTNTQHNFPLGGIIAKAKTKGAKIKLDTSSDKKAFKVGFLFKAKQDTNAFSIKDAKNKNYELRTPKINQWSYKELFVDFPLQISALQQNAELGGYFITNKNDNIFLDTVAINGAKSDLWLSWDQAVVQKQLQILHNDLIILAYGSNDVLFKGFQKQEFKNKLKKWIKILKSYNKNAIILLISPPLVVQKQGKNYKIAPDFFTIRKALYEIAKEEKTLLFDMYQFMQDSGGKNRWIEQKLSLNDVHLSVKGYELMARKMLQDLKKILAY